MSPIVLDKGANCQGQVATMPDTLPGVEKDGEEEINMRGNDGNISSYRPFHIDPFQFDMFPYDLQTRLYLLDPLHQ
jgi:hypothetical protein